MKKYVHYIIVQEGTWKFWNGKRFSSGNKAIRYPTLKDAKEAAPKRKGLAVLASNSNAKKKYWELTFP